MGTKDVVQCSECGKWRVGKTAVHENGRTFCREECRRKWELANTEVPPLSDYLKKTFLPYVVEQFKSTPKTALYYGFGSKLLSEASIGKQRIDRITSRHVSEFTASQSHLAVSTQNSAIRTLRRALNLAADEWHLIDRAPKLKTLSGEVKRERVLTPAEFTAYIELCRQPWRDVAITLIGTGARPSEVYELRWEDVTVSYEAAASVIHIRKGKTEQAKRNLQLLPEVSQTLTNRWEFQRRPRKG